MSRTFSSLAIPNYRMYWLGTTASNVGGWMARTAQGWLVLVTLTQGNGLVLGWLTGVMFAPALLLGPTAGWLADRVPKRTILFWTQSVSALDSLLLGLLIITGQIQLWHVFVIAAMDGIASAIDMPARQAFVSEVVPHAQLPNAIGLNATGFNAARLIGPGIAGALIAGFGTGPVFIVNGISFIAMLLALALLDTTKIKAEPRSKGRGQIRDGLAYVRSRSDLILLMFIAFVMGTFAFNFAITNPLMTTEAFGKGPAEFGALGSSMGAGALLGSLLVARRTHPRFRHVIVAMGLFCIVSLASALAPDFWTFALLTAGAGMAAVTANVTSQALVQRSLAPGVRGRVMALWSALLMGGTPFISPVLGWIGEAFGPRWTIVVGVVAIGLAVVVATSYILRHDNVRVSLDRQRPWVRVIRPESTLGDAPTS